VTAGAVGIAGGAGATAGGAFNAGELLKAAAGAAGTALSLLAGFTPAGRLDIRPGVFELFFDQRDQLIPALNKGCNPLALQNVRNIR
jgi:hypothetical protein